MTARVELWRAGRETEDAETGQVTRWLSIPGKWKWRFISHGHVMVESHGYSRRIDALNGAAIVLAGRVGPNNARLDLPGHAGLDAWLDRYDLGRDEWQVVPVIDLTRKGKR